MTAPEVAAVETVMRVQQDHRLFASGLHIDCTCKAAFDMWVMARAHVAREVVAALDLDARDRAAEKRGAAKALRDVADDIEQCDPFSGEETRVIRDRADWIEAEDA